MSWQFFELEARKAIEEKLNMSLSSRGLLINGKIKNFDLVNEKNKVVGDIKNFKITSGGNRPSAKFSTLNEYVWLMQLLEKYDGHKCKKLFVIGEDLKMVKMYVNEFDKWLDDIEIYFYSKNDGLKKIR